MIDSGCDTTVIPEGLARAVGLNFEGTQDKIYGFRESNEVIHSKAKITFLGREYRQTITLNEVPIVIALAKDGFEDEEDITLGIDKIFDVFNITFKKHENKIIFKEAFPKKILHF